VTSLVFDATALSHFARAGRTDELQTAVADDEPILLAEVAAELVRGIPGHPLLGSAASRAWLKQVELEEVPELAAFARFKGELGGGPNRNNGEAAVLAWISVNGGIAIIDEAVARTIGGREGLQVHGSLWVLIRSFKASVRYPPIWSVISACTGPFRCVPNGVICAARGRLSCSSSFSRVPGVWRVAAVMGAEGGSMRSARQLRSAVMGGLQVAGMGRAIRISG
jgi:predicted nucleic acid-binding protein